MTDGITIQVFTGVDAPVVVKTATTDAARQTLTREASRLERGRHPGVVSLRSATESRLELTFAGSHTLETARLAVPAAAGILAAVAETIADLHALGIVHGRLDPSHVVLGNDGRPVLCGMRGPDPEDLHIGPADDVAAIGRLIDHLLGPEAEPEPIPDRRWARRNWSGYHRRSLQLLADRASHEDPARRPTARAVAQAIVEAVPEARVAPSAPDPDQHRAAAADTIEVAPPPDARTPASADPAGEAEADVAEAAEPASTPNPAPGRPAHRDHGDLPSGDGPLRIGPFLPDAPVGADVRDAPAGEPERILGLRVDTGPSGPADPAPGTTAARELRRGPRSGRPGARAPLARPIASRRLVGAAAMALSVVALVWFGLGPTPPLRADDASAPPATTAPTPTLPTTVEPPAGPTSADLPPSTAGPADRDLGPPPSATRVHHHGVTYAVGEPHDRVVVADWDCDGHPTPGVLRPTTGEIFFFPRWADPDQPFSIPASAVVDDARHLRPPDVGDPAPATHQPHCLVVVERHDGSTVTLVADGDRWQVAEATP